MRHKRTREIERLIHNGTVPRRCRQRKGWPRQCLQAQMDQEGRRHAGISRRLAPRLYPPGSAERTDRQDASRQQATGRLQEAEAGHHHQDHPLPRAKGPQVRKGDSGRGDGPDPGDAGERQLEDCQLQALQLRRKGWCAERWRAAPAEQGARGVSQDLLPPGIRGDAYC